MNPLIVSVARTPITQSFKGALAGVPATRLGSLAIKGALERAKVAPNLVTEVYFGQVLQAAVGQAPARQASLGAGLSNSVVCTTVNKVCASGMKAIMLGAQSIKLGDNNIVIAGGMESMSNVPWHLARAHRGYGKIELIDGIENDGYLDAYNHIAMGSCAENTCKKLDLTRQQQDDFAISSYKRSAQANDSGLLAKEIVPVELPAKKSGTPPKIIAEDEEFRRIDFARMAELKPAFDRTNGTITAANASTINDGAAATLIMSAKAVDEHKLSPLAEIVAFADAACDPIDFPVAPALSIPKALEKAKLNVGDISRWEINEAFSGVVLANIKLLKLDPKLVNINGGAVSLGHPIGMSGARIVNSLAIHLKPGQYGVASVCNGGGGASTVVVKRL